MKEFGVGRGTFQGVKKRIRGTGELNLRTLAVRKLLCVLEKK